ncbi:hypothetical protein, variant [Phytophthora nicotianae P1976]|uniref:Tyrosinase copper-binding domain-containing protein n=1 Tax=Phytophthora nicotianae P1976 TaxID=1317066 RepID=A0A080ZVP9_PHYNI|nr:hypothetical protein F444_12829 [Phytophthora nicotianae P1976]ETO70711.1 hypothetical protein, variant [Phytophthora nicotianae P1976]
MRFCGRQVPGLLFVVCLLLSDIYHCVVDAQQATNCPNRVRKSWGALAQAERSLYVEALGVGMQRGYHILFTEVASEKASSTEFLRTCGFLYWNRRFVLAYENMLRSLGSKYACLTIPYWDYFADYARFVENKCENGGASLEACSPILRGLGGSQGAARSVTINGRTIAGNCVTNAPAKSFCESSTITNSSQCARCIPRGNWASKTFPAGFGYAGLGVALGEANGFRDVTQRIQTGTHNAIHNALSSVLASYVSPADPVFFSIHATVDLLDQIYLECQLGDDVVPTDKNVSRWAFQQCVYKDEVSPTAISNVTQLWMVDSSYPTSKTPIRAEDHPALSQFFKPLPSKYWQYVNINKLGKNSYQYDRDDLILNMQSYGFVCPKRGAPITTVLASTMALMETANTEEISVEVGSNSETEGPGISRELHQMQTNSFEMEQQERVYVQEQAIDLLETTLVDALDVDGTAKTAFTQAELIECQYHYDTVGGVEDYSSVFRSNYGLSPYDHPRCWELVRQMQTGNIEIRVDNWRSIMDDHFNSSSIDGSSSEL